MFGVLLYVIDCLNVVMCGVVLFVGVVIGYWCEDVLCVLVLIVLLVVVLYDDCWLVVCYVCFVDLYVCMDVWFMMGV